MPQITIKELHNDLLKPKDERSCSYARDKNSSVIISDTTHIKLLPSNLSNINNRYQSMCGCEIFIYVSMVHTGFNACGLQNFQKLKVLAEKFSSRQYGNLFMQRYEKY